MEVHSPDEVAGTARRLKFDQPPGSHNSSACALHDDRELAMLLQQQELALYNMTAGSTEREQQLSDAELARRLQAEEELYAVDDDFHEQLEAAPDIDALQYEELQALGDVVGTVSRGLPAEALDKLPSQPFQTLPPSSSLPEKCCICQCEYESADDVSMLSCKHVFHRGCLTQWLLHHKTCPYCNSELQASDGHGHTL